MPIEPIASDSEKDTMEVKSKKKKAPQKKKTPAKVVRKSKRNSSDPVKRKPLKPIKRKAKRVRKAPPPPPSRRQKRKPAPPVEKNDDDDDSSSSSSSESDSSDSSSLSSSTFSRSPFPQSPPQYTHDDTSSMSGSSSVEPLPQKQPQRDRASPPSPSKQVPNSAPAPAPAPAQAPTEVAGDSSPSPSPHPPQPRPVPPINPPQRPVVATNVVHDEEYDSSSEIEDTAHDDERAAVSQVPVQSGIHQQIRHSPPPPPPKRARQTQDYVAVPAPPSVQEVLDDGKRKKRGRGRKPTGEKFIPDKKKRDVCYSKRKGTFAKKAAELNLLTRAGTLSVSYYNGHLYIYASDGAMKALIIDDRFKQALYDHLKAEYDRDLHTNGPQAEPRRRRGRPRKSVQTVHMTTEQLEQSTHGHESTRSSSTQAPQTLASLNLVAERDGDDTFYTALLPSVRPVVNSNST